MISLMYHFVRGEKNLITDNFQGLSVEQLESQISFLLSHYEPLKHSDMMKCIESNNIFPEKCFILTFDDGTIDHYYNVLPVLEKFNISGYFFPVVGPHLTGVLPILEKQRFLQYIAYPLYRDFLVEFINNIDSTLNIKNSAIFDFPDNINDYSWYLSEHEFYSNEERYYRYIRDELLELKDFEGIIEKLFSKYYEDDTEYLRQLYLSEDNLIEMSKTGMTIGGHSVTHPDLTNISPKNLVSEIEDSIGYLKKITDKDIDVFAYPYGCYNDNVINVLKDNNIYYSFATKNRISKNTDSIFKLSRIDGASFKKISEI